MNATRNLTGSEALEKLRTLTKETPTCMFASGFSVVPFHVCPMHVQCVDDNGSFWFFSSAHSSHNVQLIADPRTQLIFSNVSRGEYLTVYGETLVCRDPVKIEELWSKSVEEWFPAGKDDPELTLLRVRPVLAHYWDTEDGRLVTLAKNLTSAITGQPSDDGGVDGNLKV